MHRQFSRDDILSPSHRGKNVSRISELQVPKNVKNEIYSFIFPKALTIKFKRHAVDKILHCPKLSNEFAMAFPEIF